MAYGNALHAACLSGEGRKTSFEHSYPCFGAVASKARVSATTRSWNFRSRTSSEPSIGLAALVVVEAGPTGCIDQNFRGHACGSLWSAPILDMGSNQRKNVIRH
jgi:hypothetical protein